MCVFSFLGSVRNAKLNAMIIQWDTSRTGMELSDWVTWPLDKCSVHFFFVNNANVLWVLKREALVFMASCYMHFITEWPTWIIKVMFGRKQVDGRMFNNIGKPTDKVRLRENLGIWDYISMYCGSQTICFSRFE